MAIPEIRDQVIVNFVHQHPDRPFVMGGMFHGGVGGGGGNNIKSLSSKSGNIICLNDGAGIEIKDRNGNHVTLSGSGDVTTFVSNNNSENIGNEHTTEVKAKSTIKVDGDQSVLIMDNGGKISITSKTEIKLETGSSSIIMKQNGDIVIKGINVTVEGATTKIIGSTLTEIGKVGADAGMKVDANVTIKGENVDIN